MNWKSCGALLMTTPAFLWLLWMIFRRPSHVCFSTWNWEGFTSSISTTSVLSESSSTPVMAARAALTLSLKKGILTQAHCKIQFRYTTLWEGFHLSTKSDVVFFLYIKQSRVAGGRLLLWYRNRIFTYKHLASNDIPIKVFCICISLAHGICQSRMINMV